MTTRRQELIQHYYQNKISDCELLVDNIWDPHNVAAITRSCDGFGIKTINLYYTYNQVFDFKKTGKASSSSSNRWVLYNPIYAAKSKLTKKETLKLEDRLLEAKLALKEWAKQKKKEGFVIIGSSLQETSTVLNSFKFPEKFILVIGNEKSGISSEIRDICDKFIYIPMLGMVESYNVSVASAIFLYEIFKQKGQNLQLRTENDLFGVRD
jgi:tRNA (guanosine-2'-O-)-methyltransferase